MRREGLARRSCCGRCAASHPRHDPARHLRRRAEAAALVVVVHLDDQSVRLVGQVVALGRPVVDVGDHVVFEQGFQSLFPNGSGDNVTIFGAQLQYAEIGTVVLILVVVGAIHLLLSRTRFGLAMRCVADDASSAQLLGIDIGRAVRAPNPDLGDSGMMDPVHPRAPLWRGRLHHRGGLFRHVGEPAFEAAGPAVQNEDLHPGQRQSRIFGMSSPYFEM